MPRQDGVEACREFMEKLPATQVLMLTALTRDGRRERGGGRRCDGLLAEVPQRPGVGGGCSGHRQRPTENIGRGHEEKPGDGPWGAMGQDPSRFEHPDRAGAGASRAVCPRRAPSRTAPLKRRGRGAARCRLTEEGPVTMDVTPSRLWNCRRRLPLPGRNGLSMAGGLSSPAWRSTGSPALRSASRSDNTCCGSRSISAGASSPYRAHSPRRSLRRAF